jgi:hypothetical protein
MLLRLATSRILLFGFFAATSRDLLFFFYNHHVVLLHEDINFATMSSTKSILLPLYNFFSGEIFGADKVVFFVTIAYFMCYDISGDAPTRSRVRLVFFLLLFGRTIFCYIK